MAGKEVGTELLVCLHELPGLKFREVIKLPIFSDLQ